MSHVSVVQDGEQVYFRLASGEVLGKDHAVVLLNLILHTYDNWQGNEIEEFNAAIKKAQTRILHDEKRPRKPKNQKKVSNV